MTTDNPVADGMPELSADSGDHLVHALTWGDGDVTETPVKLA